MLTEPMLGEARGSMLSISRRVSDVEPEPIQWLWKNRLALGKLNLLAGLPGVGKTQLVCALAGIVTTGRHLPDGEMAPMGSVVFIGCEDGVADTLRPRLEAAGADLDKVHVLDWVMAPNRKGELKRHHFSVSEHGDALEELCARIGDVRLIVIDPITAHCGKTDTHVAGEVRVALTPLQTTAERIGASVVMISHLNKGGSSNDVSAMGRINGSGAFVALSRSAWVIGPDPKDAEKRRMIFAPVKNNLSPDKSAIAYTIEGCESSSGMSTSRLKFDPIRLHGISADELVQASNCSDDERRTARNEACEFLREELAHGPVPSKDLANSAREAGIASATLKRAKADLGVKARKNGERWMVAMPSPRRQGDQGDQEYQEF